MSDVQELTDGNERSECQTRSPSSRNRLALALCLRQSQVGNLDSVSWCLEYAISLKEVNGKVPSTYLEQVNLAGIQAIQKFWKQGRVVAHRPFDAFLELAAYLNLQDYIRLKLECTKPSDLRKALKATASRGDLSEWLKGRHCLLKLQTSFKSGNADDLVRKLQYHEKPPALRLFSSKPKCPQPQYVRRTPDARSNSAEPETDCQTAMAR
jgi:hypothetical protein